MKQSHILGVVVVVFILFVFFFLIKKEEQPKERLNVIILNCADELKGDLFRQTAQDYAKAHPDLIVGATVETVEPGASLSEILEHLKEADVALFPSVLNGACRTRLESFYPLSATEAVIPPLLDTAYAGQQADTGWAAPLMIDPVVMVTKKTAVQSSGEEMPPSTWPNIELMGGLAVSTGNGSYPLFRFIWRGGCGLTDSIAAHQLALGYDKFSLHKDIEKPREVWDESTVLTRGLKVFKQLMDEENPIEKIPDVKTLEAFLETKSIITFARYSAYRSLPEPMRDQVFVTSIPSPDKMSVICYAAAAAVPITAGNPERAKEFIHNLLSKQDSLSESHGCLPARWPWEGVPLNYPSDTIFILRENLLSAPDNIVIDVLNGNLDILEFDQYWKPGFFFSAGNV